MCCQRMLIASYLTPIGNIIRCNGLIKFNLVTVSNEKYRKCPSFSPYTCAAVMYGLSSLYKLENVVLSNSKLVTLSR